MNIPNKRTNRFSNEQLIIYSNIILLIIYIIIYIISKLFSYIQQANKTTNPFCSFVRSFVRFVCTLIFNPVGEGDGLEGVGGDEDVAGVDVGLAKQELIDEGLYLGILALGQLTVHVTAVDGVAHAVGNAKLAPHLAGSV